MAFRELERIDFVADGFSFDDFGINCFTVPKYLATSRFGSENRMIFYAYFYLYAHYHLIDVSDAWTTAGRDQLEQFVLSSKLGLELKTVNLGGDLRARICEAINEGWPVFVPVNRGEFFYTKGYRQEAFPHLVLVKGYNDETDIVVLHDHEQNRNALSVRALKSLGSCYSEFYIPFVMVEHLNRSYNERFSYLRDKIMVMRRRANPIVTDSREALSDIFNALSRFEGDTGRLMDRKLARLLGTGELKKKIQQSNSQQVLIHTLSSMMKLCILPDAAIKAVEQNGMAAFATWKKFITLLAVMDKRRTRQEDMLDRVKAEIREAENGFLDILRETLSRIM